MCVCVCVCLCAGGTKFVLMFDYGHLSQPQIAELIAQKKGDGLNDVASMPVPRKVLLTHTHTHTHAYECSCPHAYYSLLTHTHQVMLLREVFAWRKGNTNFSKFALPQRPFLGPTSLPHDLAFAMANQALVRKGSMVRVVYSACVCGVCGVCSAV
jgi:hypothetical protein